MNNCPTPEEIYHAYDQELDIVNQKMINHLISRKFNLDSAQLSSGINLMDIFFVPATHKINVKNIYHLRDKVIQDYFNCQTRAQKFCVRNYYRSLI